MPKKVADVLVDSLVSQGVKRVYGVVGDSLNGIVSAIRARPGEIEWVDGKFFAIDNKCLHRGGPLGEGELSGQTIVCPWHGWKYNVATGSLEIIPMLKVGTYKVVVESSEVFVEIPSPEQVELERRATEQRR